MKELYGNQAFELINEKYGTEDCTDKLLERYIDGGKHDKKYDKVEFASALANTIKLDNIDLNKFTNAVNNFLRSNFFRSIIITKQSYAFHPYLETYNLLNSRIVRLPSA